jgi:hypothetical protein
MYLVMEFITLTAAPIDRTAQALVWFSSIPPPPNHMIGPLGGGRIRHKFFKDYTAPLLFSSVEALQRYMRKVRPCFYLLEHPPFAKMQSGPGVHVALDPGPEAAVSRQLSPIEISGDSLMFTQPDMHPSNFGVDQHGKTVLMDFAKIGLFPETLVAHTMFSEKRLAPIAIALNLSVSSNATMAAISSLLWMVASPKLGAATCA